MEPTKESLSAQAAALREGELIGRIAQGDRQAFVQLYDYYAPSLYSFVIHILNDPRDAQEVLQEIFLQIWEQSPTYSSKLGTPFGWAVILTRNQAVLRLRKRKPFPDLADPNATAHRDESVQHGSALQAWAVLSELRDDHRHPIELACFKGLSLREIAVTLKESPRAISARIRHGMLQLRDTLAGRMAEANQSQTAKSPPPS